MLAFTPLGARRPRGRGSLPVRRGASRRRFDLTLAPLCPDRAFGGLTLAGSAASVTGVLDFYVVYQTLHVRPMDAAMITALAGIITALLGGSAWAIYRRTGSE